MAKNAYYFSHDSNAHKDPKILKLRVKHGWEGYGIYWAIIETLREQDDYKWLANDKQLLSFCFANGDDVVNQVIDTCLEIGLLVNDGEFIYSESLSRRMKLKDEISEKRRAAGKKGGVSKSLANAKQNPSNKKKVKESKEKESKSKEDNSSSRNSKTYDEESIPYQLSLRLLKSIRQNNPEFKEPNLQKWSNDFHLIMDRDNRTEEQIIYLIDWCQRDSFWMTNILSPSKLRKQFDQLVMNIKANKQKKQKSVQDISTKRPSSWEEPEALTDEEIRQMRELQEELPY